MCFIHSLLVFHLYKYMHFGFTVDEKIRANCIVFEWLRDRTTCLTPLPFKDPLSLRHCNIRLPQCNQLNVVLNSDFLVKFTLYDMRLWKIQIIDAQPYNDYYICWGGRFRKLVHFERKRTPHTHSHPRTNTHTRTLTQVDHMYIEYSPKIACFNCLRLVSTGILCVWCNAPQTPNASSSYFYIDICRLCLYFLVSLKGRSLRLYFEMDDRSSAAMRFSPRQYLHYKNSRRSKVLSIRTRSPKTEF